MKVLLVEDDRIVQKVHQLMLVKLGCQVDIAQTGGAALLMVTENSYYDIIFVDIGLPDICGFDVMKSLTENQHCKAKIYALTGYTGDEEKRACLAAGATQVLFKPIVLNTMREVINSFSVAS